jgi:hypothetical protein
MHNFKFRKFIVFFVLIFVFTFILPKTVVFAQSGSLPFQDAVMKHFGMDLSGGITTNSPGTLKKLWIQTKETMLGFLKDIQNQKWEWAQKAFSATTFKKALKAYTDKLAYETAIYIATGDKGQAPLFNVNSPMEVVANAADNVAGYFIESIGENNGLFKDLNLCEPDTSLRIDIGLGLLDEHHARRPKCTFTEMTGNWQEYANDPNFLNDFQDWFDHSSNDLGIALTLQTGMFADAALTKENGKAELIAKKGWLDVRKIDGKMASVPGYAESKVATANFLKTIDCKITHCQAQIDQTEVWKKGLLQKMFV